MDEPVINLFKMENILIIGAGGQIGSALTAALQKRNYNVIAADVKEGADIVLDALDEKMLKHCLQENHIHQVYLLAAILSATGEKQPLAAWHLNTQTLLNLLELARQNYFKKLFWPSSIAVFNRHGELEPSTMYGVTKLVGEKLCQYYFRQYKVDVRSVRYPGLISCETLPGGGTTDYAVHIYHAALKDNHYTCFLQPDTRLPMMYMPDAVRATIELMEAPVETIRQRTAYNAAGICFSPAQIAVCIKKYLPSFLMDYNPDERQLIADDWPAEVDDTDARLDWGWQPKYGLDEMTKDMLHCLNVKKEQGQNIPL